MLASLFLSKVATLTQSNILSAIFPYVHFYLATGEEHSRDRASPFVVYICWYVLLHNSEVHGRFYGFDKNGTCQGRISQR